MRTGYMAIGLAAVVGVVPASFAQASRVLDIASPRGPGLKQKKGRRIRGPGAIAGISLAVPIGRVCVGPEVVDGGPSYVRRITAKEGMAIVEVSATPFMPDLASSEAPPGVL